VDAVERVTGKNCRIFALPTANPVITIGNLREANRQISRNEPERTADYQLVTSYQISHLRSGSFSPKTTARSLKLSIRPEQGGRRAYRSEV
jgi:hypothetical protein